MAASAIVTEFLNAINALYTHPDSSVKQQANEWLSAFQRKPAAWEVADQVLQRPGLDTQFYYFAANTLRQKLCYDFADLASSDPKSRASFRDSLLQHVLRFKSAPSAVRVRLALCVGSLAVHLAGSGEWPTALDDLTSMLGSNPTTALCLLDILEVAPEECGSSKLAVSQERRALAQKTFSQFAPKILTILHSYLMSTGTNRELQNKVLLCLLSWVRQGGIDPNSMPTSEIFKSTWDALAIPELFETSCDVIAEILHQSEDPIYTELMQFMIPRVLSLVPRYEKAVREGDEDVSRKLASVFIEMGESYVTFIGQGSEIGLTCARVLLTCASHPVKELASHAFKFWFLLSRELSASTVPQERKAAFFPHFAQMVEVCRVVMQYGDDYSTWDADQKEECKRYRYFAAETLLDCTKVLGDTNTLRLIWTTIAKELERYQADRKQWYGLEAALYCIRSIARTVQGVEREVIPRTMELIPKLVDEPQLRYTATLIIGRYSDWLARPPQNTMFLGPLLTYVVVGLNDKEVASSAALAFKFVCEGCATLLCQPPFIENLFDVYRSIRRLVLQDQKEIIDGMANVVSALPPAQVFAGLQKLIQPIGTDIASVLSGAEPESRADGKEHESEAGLLPSLDRLAQVFRCLDPAACSDATAVPTATVKVMEMLWPMLETIIDRHRADEKKMERLCRCWKYALKSTQWAFAPLLPRLVTLLCKYYQTNPHSSFLYTVSICVDQFGPRAEFHDILREVYRVFSARTFFILKDADSFMNHPEIVEDYFEMLVRLLRTAPDIIFTATAPGTEGATGRPLLFTVFECGLAGLGVHHREACASLMQFFGTLIRSGVDSESANNDRKSRPSPMHVQVLTSLLKEYGQTLVDRLLAGIGGMLPSARVRYAVGVVEQLLEFCKEPTHGWFTRTLSKMQEVSPSKAEFMHSLFSATNLKDVRQALDAFSKACRFGEH